MAVLMTYHTLVEKDADKVGFKWKGIILALLICGVGSCITSSLMLHTLVHDFDDRCVLNADLKFEKKTNATVQSFASASATSSTNNNIAPTTSENMADFYKNQYYSKLRGFIDKDEFSDITTENIGILLTNEINFQLSKWGKPVDCDYGIFIPLFEATFSIIMITFFLICGNGGKTQTTALLPQPWRIVIPAAIFFLFMTIISIIHLVIVKGINSLCEQFAQEVPGVSCSLAMNNFVPDSNKRLIYPGTSYMLLKIFVWVTMICWIASFITMLCRIVLVADFQIVKVTVKTKEGETSRSSDYRSVNTNDDESVSSGSQVYQSLEPIIDEAFDTIDLENVNEKQ